MKPFPANKGAWYAVIAAGAFTLFALNLPAATRYVDLNSSNPTPPYTSWPTAATNIQDAIDIAAAGDTVLVTNGIYQTGGYGLPYQGSNRVFLNKPLIVQSVNGPAATVIQAEIPFARCAYLTNGAVLSGFTLTNGTDPTLYNVYGAYGAWEGGGVKCLSTNNIVTNCVITGNYGFNGAGAFGGTLKNCRLENNLGCFGGGAMNSTLENCLIISNRVRQVAHTAPLGGGAAYSTVINCTVVNNSSANYGGGTHSCDVINSIVYHNTAASGSNWYSYSTNRTFLYSCTLPSTGPTVFTNEPRFVSRAAGNFQLQSNSPGINSGTNLNSANSLDLAANPRVVAGRIDLGAYEYQNPLSAIPHSWFWQYGLPIDANTDATDTDGDGLNNWQEWRAGTNPTNYLSALRMMSIPSGPSGNIVFWQSIPGVRYDLERSTNLSASPAFLLLKSNLLAGGSTTGYVDTNVVGPGPFLYRVGVR